MTGFTVGDVKKLVDEKSQANRMIYRELLDMCHRRIKTRVEQDKRATEVTFVLPPFIVGKPVFNKDHAIRYIVDKLKLGGFRAEPRSENHAVYVSWDVIGRRKKKPAAAPAAAAAPASK